MLTDIPALYFPYYQNIWNIIKFKPDNEQLIWFRTMSRMMFENMERPKEPVVGFTSDEERVVWDAYNTILPALTKVMKVSKFATQEFKEKARINGRKGGRPRKSLFGESDSTAKGDSAAEDGTLPIKGDETAGTPVPVADRVILMEMVEKEREKDRISLIHSQKMKEIFPDIKAFRSWVIEHAVQMANKSYRDETCLKYIYRRLNESGYLDYATGEPIPLNNLHKVVNRIANYFYGHRKEILEIETSGSKADAATVEDQNREDALDSFYKSRLIASKNKQGTVN